jgi:K+-transporting ATPase KdpF subunit
MNLLALAMSGDDLVGIIIAVLVTAYLVYALIRPEKL